MPGPIISICIPTYNGAAYLEGCLQSIEAQTLGNFEVLVVDDNSSDHTLQIARDFERKDARFQVHANARRLGLVGNWNRAVTLARGTWVKMVFQDDLLLPNCLERMMAAARPSGPLFLTCRRDFLFESETSSETRQYYADNAAEIEQLFSGSHSLPPGEFARVMIERFCGNIVGEPTATLLHRSLFDRFGLFNENLIMCCDSEYWYRAGSQIGVTFVPETLAVFRVHKRSTSAENFGRRQFRTRLLDPLVILLEFTSNPVYKKLRQIARQQFRAGYLADLCREYAAKAFREVTEKEAQGMPDAAESAREWKALCREYPRLPALARPQGHLTKLWFKGKSFSFRRTAARLAHHLTLKSGS